MSYVTRQAKRGREVEVGVSPVKVCLFITATIAYFLDTQDADTFVWWAVGVGLGLSVGIGWGLTRWLLRDLDDDDETEDEDD